MRKFGVVGFLFVLLSTAALYGFTELQSPQIDRKQLKEMLTQLGYEVKDLVTDPGKEKYTVTITKDGLDIPIGFEISPSLGYIWLTVNLGTAPTDGNSKTLDLLKQNSKIQPTFFYITDKGLLMAGLPIDNRGVTNVTLRQRAESIAENVGKTQSVWK